jgi:aminoglycoside 2''-phosphotransferase
MMDADGRWMIRIPRWESSARSLGFEVHLLDFLSQHTSVRVPRPSIIGTLSEPAGWPFLAYPKLPGIPLESLARLTGTERAKLGGFLKGLFADLDRCPARSLLRMGAQRGNPAAYSERFERLRHRYRRIGARHLPSELCSRVYVTLNEIISTLGMSRYRPVLIHGDLWPSHILWSPRSHRPVAVIDWEDARLGDPAADLTAFTDLGEEILADVGGRRRQRGDTLFWQRLGLYRRILPLWGYLFGLETKNSRITRKHLLELRGSHQFA